MTDSSLDIRALLERRVRFDTHYSAKDVILYHLGIGCGDDPVDAAQLRFVYEKRLVVLPTFATTLIFGPRLITQDDGFDLTKMLHGEQTLELHRPIPIEGQVTCETRIEEIIDKGADKGCIIVESYFLASKETGEKLATLRGFGFYRGDGGRGGTTGELVPSRRPPDRAPDKILAAATRPGQAALYRLSGDYNPLHIDPDTAHAAGFPRPILHGLCSYGIACRAVVEAFLPGEPDRLGSLSARFSAPVFPGETLVTELWREGDTVFYRCKAKERDVIVLDRGSATLL